MGLLALNKERRLDGSRVLLVRGRVDDATVECFERALDWATGAGSQRAIIDLTSCRLDSAGLAALVRLKRRSTGRSAKTRLVVPDLELFRTLQMTGLTSQFRTYRTVDAALHVLPAAPSAVASGTAVVALRVSSRHAGPRGERRGLEQVHSSPDGHGRRGTSLLRRPVGAGRPSSIESTAGDE